MRAAALAATLMAVLLSACGSGEPQLRVAAAASLRAALTRYSRSFTGARVSDSFAGSDALAAQIERGARPDVFAAASVSLPARLFAAGLVERPVRFAANTLVVAVPRRSPIHGLAQIMVPGLKLAVGTPTVPVGSYTAAVIARLPAAQRRVLSSDVRDREPDVTGIVGKLVQGAVDAGFVYATDVAATHGAIRAIEIPAQLQPRVGYAIAVVRGTEHGAQARAFIAGLLRGPGRADLRAAGFLPPAGG